MKVLHLASFTGNIGDEANHNGFRRKFKENVDKECEFHNLEIREFYKSWGKRKFDDDFVKMVNEYDLLIIGGGNFFELCWDYSATGTTIDISIDRLEKIKIPILINGMGVDDGKGINENNIKKFGDFLKYILSKDNILMSVRNDGSMKILNKYYKDLSLEKIYNIPDGGFFFKTCNLGERVEICKDKRNIGINIAGDMMSRRFNSDEGFNIFISEFVGILNNILNKNSHINLVFYPHVYIDLSIINSIIERLDDEYRRTCISVAPLLNNSLNGGDYIFGSYEKCNLILSMRFHANVCSIGQCIPSIGLITYHKHGYLFEELGMKDRMVNITNNLENKDFWVDLENKINYSLNNEDEIKIRYRNLMKELNRKSDEFCKVVREWLEKI